MIGVGIAAQALKVYLISFKMRLGKGMSQGTDADVAYFGLPCLMETQMTTSQIVLRTVQEMKK